MQLVGRKSVGEALRSGTPRLTRVSLASSARGIDVDDIRRLAQAAGVAIEQVSERRLDNLAGDDRQHQGVVATAVRPDPWSLESFLAQRNGRAWITHVLVLDHVHNPANVGMILRTAAGAGIDAVVLPRQGTAQIGPLTIKAGSGMVFAVPIVETETVEDALIGLAEAGFATYGLDAGGDQFFETDLGDRVAMVLGNETLGLSSGCRELIHSTLALPLANGVESLNVAAAAAIVSYDLNRRRTHP